LTFLQLIYDLVNSFHVDAKQIRFVTGFVKHSTNIYYTSF